MKIPNGIMNKRSFGNLRPKSLMLFLRSRDARHLALLNQPIFIADVLHFNAIRQISMYMNRGPISAK